MRFYKTPPDTAHTDNDLELLLKEVIKVIMEVEAMLADEEGEEE